MDPSDLLSTPEGYASPQQIAQMRLLAGTLMAPKGTQEKMQSWTQPAAQMVQALLGTSLMRQAQQREQSLAGAGLGGGSVGGPAAPLPADAGGAPPGPGSDAAADWAKQFEGFSPRAQWDYKQYSNGYGTKAGGPGETITPDVADQRLKSEFGKAYGMVQQRFPSLNPNQTAALADLTYNVGPGWMQGTGLMGHWLVKAVDAGDWQTVGQVLQQYNHAGGKVVPALTARRTQEAQLMNAPASPGQAPNAAPAPSAPGQPQTGTFVPPEFARRQAPITANDVYAARMRGDPKAEELYMLFKQQQSGVPMEMPDPSGIGNVLVSRGDPTHQLRMLPKPEIQKMKAGDIEYPQMLQMTPQGMQNWPVIGGGQGGMPGAQPPQAGGGAAPPGVGGQQPPIQQPTDFGSAAAADVALKGREAQTKALNEGEGKSYASEHIGVRATAENLGQQMPILQVAKSILNDDSFYSGTAADAILRMRRAGVAVGENAKDAATPMEVFNKVISANILQQTNQLKAEAESEGFSNNRLFRQQVGLMEKAAQSSDNTRSGNMYLTNFLMWQAQRARKIADMADDYAVGHGGGLDAGFSKMMRGKMFDDPEFQLPKEFQFPHPAAAQVGGSGAEGGADILSSARDAIARGAPRDKVIERLKAKGIDPGGM